MTVEREFSEDDLRDARLVGTVASALAQWRTTAPPGRRGSARPLNQAIWFYWQAPRLPKPLVRSKYPKQFPWSAAARDTYLLDPKTPLVIEHVEPTSLLIQELLEMPRTDRAIAALLTDRSRCVILTPGEDARITAAGYRNRMPQGADLTVDLYVRYRSAGLDVDGFAPLED